MIEKRNLLILEKIKKQIKAIKCKIGNFLWNDTIFVFLEYRLSVNKLVTYVYMLDGKMCSTLEDRLMEKEFQFYQKSSKITMKKSNAN